MGVLSVPSRVWACQPLCFVFCQFSVRPSKLSISIYFSSVSAFEAVPLWAT